MMLDDGIWIAHSHGRDRKTILSYKETARQLSFGAPSMIL
jgi:hypothetical protein